MRYRVAVGTTVVALIIAPVSAAATWSWGFNYLGNSSSNGNCLAPAVAVPGAVCSGWNYWNSNYMDKRGGGYVYLGWQKDAYTSGFIGVSGVTQVATVPSTVGLGGYLKSAAEYVSGAASYLQTQAYS